MIDEDKSVAEMWQAYLKSVGEEAATTAKKYTSWHFCDNEADANELVELVKQGIKRATAGLVIFYEVEGEELPKDGDLSIVTNWQGKAECIIQSTKVSVVPFKDVTAEFARTEGEGDKSLGYWRQAHISAFSRELKEIQKEFSEDMMTVCEEFKVVFM
jgi:uncharacterized protein YhfF